ncbi:MAG: hypothetical protein QME06_07815 [Desulfobacterales bacterium]|nr:hypothetical protein [Desulfobacterales bacterium]
MEKNNYRDVCTRLTSADFEKMFDEEISADVRDDIDNYGFVYRNVTSDERDACIKQNISALIQLFYNFHASLRQKSRALVFSSGRQGLLEKKDVNPFPFTNGLITEETMVECEG